MALGISLGIGLTRKNVDDALRGQMIPIDFVYSGKAYKTTGETVAIEKIDASTETLNSVTCIGSVLYQSGNYDVYSIKELMKTRRLQ